MRVVLLALGLLLGVARAQGVPIPAALSATQWTTVQLPAVPLGIAVHGGDLWVCGWDAMIAESSDGGRSWSVRHFQKGGELLFTLAFADSRHVHAFGTFGFHLASSDGGRKWAPDWRPNMAVRWAYFSDPHHYLLAAPKKMAIGKSGSPRMVAAHYEVQSAALLGRRAVLLLAPPAHLLTSKTRSAPAHILVTTDDGGHWKSLQFPGGEAQFAGAAGGKFWVVGVGSAPPRKPVLIGSSDGVAWKSVNNVALRYPPENCNTQGCLLGGAAWVPLDQPGAWTGRVESLFPPPPNGVSGWVSGWAAAAGSICEVGAALRCALTHPGQLPPPQPQSAAPPASLVKPAACLSCPTPDYPDRDRTAGITGTVILHVMISRQGTIKSLHLVFAPSRSLAQSAMDAVSRWRYRPPTLGGKAQEVDSTITVSYTLRP